MAVGYPLIKMNLGDLFKKLLKIMKLISHFI